MASESAPISNNWNSYIPVKVQFGAGQLGRLPETCKFYGTQFLLCTGQSAIKTGVADSISQMFRRNGLVLRHYSEISSDPTVACVSHIMELLKDTRPDALVAIGGGSVIDAAKAASAVFAQNTTVANCLKAGKPLDTPGIPVIAVPTTAGTGAELSKGAIISDPESGIKGGLRGTAVFAAEAIVDPRLTLTVPEAQVKCTGFDILTHAIETYISIKSTPYTEMFSEMAIRRVARYLVGAVQSPENLECRTHLSFCSMTMGYNLANSSTCLPHRMQYPLGMHTGTSHGWGLGALYPAWLEATWEASRDKFENVSDWICQGLGVAKSGTPRQTVERLLSKMDFRPRLSEVNVSKEVCAQLAVRVSGNMAADPWWHQGADLTSIYVNSI